MEYLVYYNSFNSVEKQDLPEKGNLGLFYNEIDVSDTKMQFWELYESTGEDKFRLLAKIYDEELGEKTAELYCKMMDGEL